jgi:hypothetical protein
MPKGVVSFERKVLPWEDDSFHISYPNTDFWSASVIPLCRFEVFVGDYFQLLTKLIYFNDSLGL